MFQGTIQSISHEGGLLLTFTGSSPALSSIVIKSDGGEYIGKVDSVLGNTNSPLVHLGHIDRKLDLPSLIGAEVEVRAKQVREDRGRGRDGGRDRNDRGRRDDRSRSRDGGRDRYGGRDDRRGGRDRYGGRDDRRDGRDNRGRDDRRGGRDNRSRFDNGGDWDCPKCNNSNFARRTECNRCQAPRPGGQGGQDRGRRDNYRDNRGRDDRRGGRDNRGRDDRRGSRDNRNDGKFDNSNDWDCPMCKNSNFSFRSACNKCGLEREGGAPRPDRGRARNDGGRGGYGGRDGGRDNRGGRGGYGGRDGGRDNRGGYGGRDSGRSYGEGDDSAPREKPKPREFRKAKGKRSGHAHNRGPSDIQPRRYNRSDD